MCKGNKDKMKDILKDILKILPILFNIICSVICWWHANDIFYYLECDMRLLMDGQVHYRIGTGAVLLIIMILLLLISVVWILLNAKFLYQDKNRKHEYLMLSIGFVVLMDVCWIAHFLKWYSLVSVIRGCVLPPPPM